MCQRGRCQIVLKLPFTNLAKSDYPSRLFNKTSAQTLNYNPASCKETGTIISTITIDVYIYIYMYIACMWYKETYGIVAACLIEEIPYLAYRS